MGGPPLGHADRLPVGGVGQSSLLDIGHQTSQATTQPPIGTGTFNPATVALDPETGQVRNPSLATYLMPLAVDMPDIETILINVPSEDGPFGARAVAEPPGFGPPAAIANAIYDAVGVRIKTLPITPEKVARALHGGPPDK